MCAAGAGSLGVRRRELRGRPRGHRDASRSRAAAGERCILGGTSRSYGVRHGLARAADRPIPGSADGPRPDRRAIGDRLKKKKSKRPLLQPGPCWSVLLRLLKAGRELRMLPRHSARRSRLTASGRPGKDRLGRSS